MDTVSRFGLSSLRDPVAWHSLAGPGRPEMVRYCRFADLFKDRYNVREQCRLVSVVHETTRGRVSIAIGKTLPVCDNLSLGLLLCLPWMISLSLR